MARIAFIQALSFAYPGTEFLSSVLKMHGHEVAVYIEGENSLGLKAWVASFSPHIAGFSCTTGLHQWALEKAALLKKEFPAIVCVYGGPHPTHFPEMIEHAAVDVVCRGEGEYALLELADALDAGREYSSIANLWVKTNGAVTRNEVRPLVDDLDTLPLPDRSIYLDAYASLRSSRLSFMAGRGCPYTCSYCYNDPQRKLYRGKGKYVRRRSPAHLIGEIQSLHQKYRFKTVYFQDDTFTIDTKWLHAFLPRYKDAVNLPFICLITADTATPETVGLLKDAGCIRAFFGVESGDEELRRLVLKKNVTDDHIRRAARVLHGAGIRFRTYNMIGLPGETLEQAFKTIALNREIKTDYPWCSIYYPFPGTELSEYGRANMLFREDKNEALPYSFFQDSASAGGLRNEIVVLHKLFVYAIKFPIAYWIIRRLIRIRPNAAFRLAFFASYAYCFMKSENLGVLETALMGIRNIGKLLPSRKAGKR